MQAAKAAHGGDAGFLSYRILFIILYLLRIFVLLSHWIMLFDYLHEA
jgi:hypothetical protein